MCHLQPPQERTLYERHDYLEPAEALALLGLVASGHGPPGRS